MFDFKRVSMICVFDAHFYSIKQRAKNLNRLKLTC